MCVCWRRTESTCLHSTAVEECGVTVSRGSFFSLFSPFKKKKKKLFWSVKNTFKGAIISELDFLPNYFCGRRRPCWSQRLQWILQLSGWNFSTPPSAKPRNGCADLKMSPEPEPAKRWDLWPAGGRWTTASPEERDKSSFNVQFSRWGEG